MADGVSHFLSEDLSICSSLPGMSQEERTLEDCDAILIDLETEAGVCDVREVTAASCLGQLRHPAEKAYRIGVDPAGITRCHSARQNRPVIGA